MNSKTKPAPYDAGGFLNKLSHSSNSFRNGGPREQVLDALSGWTNRFTSTDLVERLLDHVRNLVTKRTITLEEHTRTLQTSDHVSDLGIRMSHSQKRLATLKHLDTDLNTETARRLVADSDHEVTCPNFTDSKDTRLSLGATSSTVDRVENLAELSEFNLERLNTRLERFGCAGQTAANIDLETLVHVRYSCDRVAVCVRS